MCDEAPVSRYTSDGLLEDDAGAVAACREACSEAMSQGAEDELLADGGGKPCGAVGDAGMYCGAVGDAGMYCGAVGGAAMYWGAAMYACW